VSASGATRDNLPVRRIIRRKKAKAEETNYQQQNVEIGVDNSRLCGCVTSPGTVFRVAKEERGRAGGKGVEAQGNGHGPNERAHCFSRTARGTKSGPGQCATKGRGPSGPGRWERRMTFMQWNQNRPFLLINLGRKRSILWLLVKFLKESSTMFWLNCQARRDLTVHRAGKRLLTSETKRQVDEAEPARC